jgi:hypothetical protein
MFDPLPEFRIHLKDPILEGNVHTERILTKREIEFILILIARALKPSSVLMNRVYLLL